MGYCARDGSGDGKANYSPRVSSLDHVADANARLSLTGKTAGYQCTQDDEGNAIVHTFNGDGADADAGLLVTGAGTTGWNGSYVLNVDQYELISDPSNFQVKSGPNWAMGGDYHLHIASTYPWNSFWDSDAGTPPAPTVTRNPIASNANWTP